MMLNDEHFYTYQAPFWKAEYHEPPLSSYRNNPLIETLPPCAGYLGHPFKKPEFSAE